MLTIAVAAIGVLGTLCGAVLGPYLLEHVRDKQTRAQKLTDARRVVYEGVIEKVGSCTVTQHVVPTNFRAAMLAIQRAHLYAGRSVEEALKVLRDALDLAGAFLSLVDIRDLDAQLDEALATRNLSTPVSITQEKERVAEILEKAEAIPTSELLTQARTAFGALDAVLMNFAERAREELTG